MNFIFICNKKPWVRAVAAVALLMASTAAPALAQQAPAPGAPAAPVPAATPAPVAEAAPPSPAPAPATPPAPPEPAPTPVPESPFDAPAPYPTPAPEPGAGPSIELAADVSTAEPSSPEPMLGDGMRDERLAEADPTSIGGYGELHYNLDNLGAPGDPEAEIDLHRLVLFLAHRFDERLRFYSEIEVEHALVGDGLPGEVGVEQAYLDYLLHGDAIGLRAGIVLVPMGIINQWHEPPVFHGVERPTVDRVIIPTTWREGGIGIFGEPTDGLRYELYVVGGLDASGFSAETGIRGGRQAVAEAHADGLAVTGRVEIEPTLGVVAGASGYVGQAGPNAELFQPNGEPGSLDVTVTGFSADLRGRAQGFEARAVFAMFHVGDTARLRNAFDADGNTLGIDVAELVWGAYGEIAYDLLSGLGTEQKLLPFLRVERYDTMADVAGRPRDPVDDTYAARDLTLGLSYRPVPQVVLKTDYVNHRPDLAPAGSIGRFDLGIGVMF